MEKISDFEVMKEMSKKGRGLKAAFLHTHPVSVDYTPKRTKITITVEAEIGLEFERYVGGLYLLDKKTYDKTRSKLEKASAI